MTIAAVDVWSIQMNSRPNPTWQPTISRSHGAQSRRDAHEIGVRPIAGLLVWVNALCDVPARARAAM